MFTLFGGVDRGPAIFPSPFDTCPHPVAMLAAADLQRRLRAGLASNHLFDRVGNGKMMGVLVVNNPAGQLGYLSGFSGMLAGSWQQPGFVPPIFNLAVRQQQLAISDARVQELRLQQRDLEQSPSFLQQQEELRQISEKAALEVARLSRCNRDRKRQRAAHRLNERLEPAACELLDNQSRHDRTALKRLRAGWQEKLQCAKEPVDVARQSIAAIDAERKFLSQQAQQQLFNDYQLACADGTRQPLRNCFIDKNPPSGAGDCAAAKLLHHANHHHYKPLAVAEFWWGAESIDGMRRHRHFYPACRGKCGPIMPVLLQGLSVAPAAHQCVPLFDADLPTVIYEDEHLLLVDKPVGMLSVAGKTIADCVEERLQQRLAITGRKLLVHRLDQATSGLLLAAKTAAVFKQLQQQFEKRQVGKRYVAIVAGRIASPAGQIDLPLRVDIDDRPRQRVCHLHGKAALSRYQLVALEGENSRVHFFPHTGRTHQLRVHAAHAQGLAAPIVGDELYGTVASRMMLHAESLEFTHPVSDERLTIQSPAPF